MTRHVSVHVEHVSKTYRIPRPDAPRLGDYVRRPAWALRAPKSKVVDALRDVSFELHEGEVLGIIGRNGAGKSTLLKVLSRITSPTSGRVTMRGHVASLLEVGTGFHPELTGRENIYLNGMLLGMSSQQVSKVFDAICDFAAVGDYINVPIKRFSSGMQLRLAFAVAAHLHADTMIVDEVLAVGDAEFQRKCLGAMRGVSRDGRTTLFVSHNMSAIEALCTRVIWLDKGEVRESGASDRVIRSYLASAVPQDGVANELLSLRGAPRTARTIGLAELSAIRFGRSEGAADRPPWRVAFGEAFQLSIGFKLNRAVPDLIVATGFRNDRGEDVLTSHSCDNLGSTERAHVATSGAATVHVSQPWLRPGTYYVEAALLSGSQLLDYVAEAATLVVDDQRSSGAPRLELKKGSTSPIWSWQFIDELQR